jgi:hypothetical protein
LLQDSSSFTDLEDILANKIKLGSAAVDELVSLVENKNVERIEYLDKDIVRKQRHRFNLLEEKVAQMQEDNIISGGNKQGNLEQLMESLKGLIRLLGSRRTISSSYLSTQSSWRSSAPTATCGSQTSSYSKACANSWPSRRRSHSALRCRP